MTRAERLAGRVRHRVRAELWLTPRDRVEAYVPLAGRSQIMHKTYGKLCMLVDTRVWDPVDEAIRHVAR